MTRQVDERDRRGLADRLGVGRGVTALVGGGGKTTLMYALAAELARQGIVIVTTTTKIRRPDHLPVLDPPTPAALRAALAAHNPLCLGSPVCRGAQCAPADDAPPPEKLTAPTLPIPALAEAADFVLVEADGAKGLPAKAHADYEPVIPPQARTVILVLGADAFGRPLREVCHRPALYAARAQTGPDDLLTPALAARVIRTEGYGNIVYVNKCESDADFRNAEALSRLLPHPVVAGSLLQNTGDGSDTGDGSLCRAARPDF